MYAPGSFGCGGFFSQSIVDVIKEKSGMKHRIKAGCVFRVEIFRIETVLINPAFKNPTAK